MLFQVISLLITSHSRKHSFPQLKPWDVFSLKSNIILLVVYDAIILIINILQVIWQVRTQSMEEHMVTWSHCPHCGSQDVKHRQKSYQTVLDNVYLDIRTNKNEKAGDLLVSFTKCLILNTIIINITVSPTIISPRLVFSHAIGMARWMEVSVVWSTTLVKAEIFQQLLNGLI